MLGSCPLEGHVAQRINGTREASPRRMFGPGGRLLHATAMTVQLCKHAAVHIYSDNEDGLLLMTAQSAGL